MFKKVKYENGKREIFFGKFRIFKYTNKQAFYLNEIRNILIHNIQSINVKTMGNAKGFEFFNFLLERALISPKYYHIFYTLHTRSYGGGG